MNAAEKLVEKELESMGIPENSIHPGLKQSSIEGREEHEEIDVSKPYMTYMNAALVEFEKDRLEAFSGSEQLLKNLSRETDSRLQLHAAFTAEKINELTALIAVKEKELAAIKETGLKQEQELRNQYNAKMRSHIQNVLDSLD